MKGKRIAIIKTTSTLYQSFSAFFRVMIPLPTFEFGNAPRWKPLLVLLYHLTSGLFNWLLPLPGVSAHAPAAQPGLQHTCSSASLGFSDIPKAGRRAGVCCNPSYSDPVWHLLKEACGVGELPGMPLVSRRSECTYLCVQWGRGKKGNWTRKGCSTSCVSCLLGFLECYQLLSLHYTRIDAIACGSSLIDEQDSWYTWIFLIKNSDNERLQMY